MPASSPLEGFLNNLKGPSPLDPQVQGRVIQTPIPELVGPRGHSIEGC